MPMASGWPSTSASMSARNPSRSRRLKASAARTLSSTLSAEPSALNASRSAAAIGSASSDEPMVSASSSPVSRSSKIRNGQQCDSAAMIASSRSRVAASAGKRSSSPSRRAVPPTAAISARRCCRSGPDSEHAIGSLMALRLVAQALLHRVLQLVDAIGALDPRGDLAVLVDHEEPRLGRQVKRRHLRPEALGDLVVVVDLHVDEVGLVAEIALDLLGDVDDRPADAALAEPRRCEHQHDRLLAERVGEVHLMEVGGSRVARVDLR